LHAHYGNYYNRRHGKSAAMNPAVHMKIDFDVFEYGIYKRRLLEGEPEDSDDWRIGHPVLFPNILERTTGGATFGYEMRIPIDDTHTMHTLYSLRKLKPDEEPPDLQAARESVRYNALGLVDAPAIILQDEMAWIGQSPISDRTLEHLATSDKGIMLFRNLLLENIEKVERGEDPLGTLRDPAQNTPFIEIKTEVQARRAFGLEGALLG
ncbi:MAG TPA: aromatic ring-hydroxylating dioxygenase subunit alpha, partial [Chloroflexota bacterium]